MSFFSSSSPTHGTKMAAIASLRHHILSLPIVSKSRKGNFFSVVPFTKEGTFPKQPQHIHPLMSHDPAARELSLALLGKEY